MTNKVFSKKKRKIEEAYPTYQKFIKIMIPYNYLIRIVKLVEKIFYHKEKIRMSMKYKQKKDISNNLMTIQNNMFKI